MASSLVDQRRVGFMDLPGELRNMIYVYHLVSDVDRSCSSLAASSSTSDSCSSTVHNDEHSVTEGTGGIEETAVMTSGNEAKEGDAATSKLLLTKEPKPQQLYPAILATSRCINAEATPIFYGRNTFTATITASAVLTEHAPALVPSRHSQLHCTRSWIIVVDLPASTPATWEGPHEGFEETVDEGRAIVAAIKKRVQEVCTVLEQVAVLEKVIIRVKSNHSWQVRSRLAGVGMVRLLEGFKGLKAGSVNIEEAEAVMRRTSIEDVRKAMLGIAGTSSVGVMSFWA